ncbi:MAG: hypothetical protein V7651_10320 [Hyphomonas oceanitis]|uniref:PIN domain-containing protein n=1 Tax=Hyphomonas oceanitis TaxID=81033 RepID=UPI003002052C
MIIGFDANIWIARYDPSIRTPIDPSSGQPITHAQQRVKALIKQAGQDKHTILIPTPVLSEVLAYTDDRRFEMLAAIAKSAHFQVASFDMKAAVELAEMNLEAAVGDKRFGSEDPYQKTKIDRQIAAICKVNDCKTFYTTDRSLGNFARRFGVEVKHLSDIPLPEETKQYRMFPDDQE